MAEFTYTQLSATHRLTVVRQRIAEIESQILTLEMRVEAPDLSQPPTEMDQGNLERLKESHTKLLEMEKSLDEEAG